MRRPSIVLIFALATTIPAVAADADAAKSAIDAARKAAGDAGIELPEIKQSDLDKLIQKAAKEVAKVREGEEKSEDGGMAAKPSPMPTATKTRCQASASSNCRLGFHRFPDSSPPASAASGRGRIS